MTFEPGQQVSHLHTVMPMTVESVKGGDVTVLEYDHNKRRSIRQTYKAATLRPTPPRRGPITFRL